MFEITGDDILTRLPPELADAAVAQWEQALRLAQQTAMHEDNAARAISKNRALATQKSRQPIRTKRNKRIEAQKRVRSKRIPRRVSP